MRCYGGAVVLDDVVCFNFRPMLLILSAIIQCCRRSEVLSTVLTDSDWNMKDGW